METVGTGFFGTTTIAQSIRWGKKETCWHGRLGMGGLGCSSSQYHQVVPSGCVLFNIIEETSIACLWGKLETFYITKS